MKTWWLTLTDPAWLPLAWSLNAAAWALMVILWTVQACMAAQTNRWPAFYIHLVKIVAGCYATHWFAASLLWREPGPALTLGALSRNWVSGLLWFALLLETVWRIKETIKARAQGKL